LTQKKISAVTILEEPYSVIDEQSYDPVKNRCTTGIKCRFKRPDSSWQNTCCSGYVLEVFRLVLADLNLEVDMYVVEDGRYGANVSGVWDGMIGDLVSGKADIAVGSIAITGERSRVVDFTSPWVEIDLGVLVKPKILGMQFVNFEFIAPLGSDIKIALWLSVGIMMFIVFMIENNRYFVSLTDDRFVVDEFYSPYESMSYIGGVTLQRDLGGINPRKPGARVASIAFAFAMVVLVTTYTALLVEQGVKREEKDPFLGSKDPRVSICIFLFLVEIPHRVFRSFSKTLKYSRIKEKIFHLLDNNNF